MKYDYIVYPVLVILILQLFGIRGYATYKLLEYSGETEQRDIVDANFINGAISGEDTAVLCFEGFSEKIGKYYFKIEIPLSNIYNNIKNIEKHKNRVRSFIVRESGVLPLIYLVSRSLISKQ